MTQTLARGASKDTTTKPEGKVARRGPQSQEPAFLHMAGNQALQRAVKDSWRVSQADDPLEREAERGVEALMRGGRVSVSNATELRVLQRKCDACAQGNEPCARCGNTSSIGSSQLSALGSGRPLPTELRHQFEPALARNLSAVRVHDGPAAAELAAQAKARAFTRGNDIVFGAGRYAPGTEGGDRLLAHELIHTAQQGESGLLYRDPLTSSEGSSESEDGAPVCEAASTSAAESESTTPQWSFDPYAEDIIGLTNGGLIDAILFTEDWLAANAHTEEDHEAYTIRQGLLEDERLERVAMGHLWLDSVKERQTTSIYQLVPAVNGATDVVQVTNLELLYGPLQDMSERPLMTEAQFQASRAGQRLPQISLEQYQQQMAEAMGAGDSGLSRGASGAAVNSSVRDRMVADAFANHSRSGRSGGIAEAFALTDAQALWGFGAQDRNRMSWVHPERGPMSGNYPLSDLHNLHGAYPPEGSVKMRLSDTAGASSPSAIRNFSTYLEGYAQMIGAVEGQRNFSHFMDNAGSGRSAADVRRDFGLIVPADDAPALRQLLSDPHARDLTPSGVVSETPNYQRAELRRIYDAFLGDAPIQLGDNGAELRSIADLDAALQSNRIGVMQHDAFLRQLGGEASGRVYANTDFTMDTARAFDSAWNAMDPSLRPQPIGERPVLHTSTRDRTGANADSLSANARFENYINRLGAVIPQNTGALHVDADDAPALQQLLRNPLGRDVTPTGRTSRVQNFQRGGLNNVYNAVLQRQPVFGPGGMEFRSVEAIQSAFDAGTLEAREYSRLMHRVGRLAAAQVQARTPAIESAHADRVRAYERSQADYRAALDATRAEIAARTSPEFAGAQRLGGGWRGDFRMAHAHSRAGGLLGAGIGILSEGGAMWFDGRDNPDAVWRLASTGLREGARGYGSTYLESLAASRVSRYTLERGMSVSASRALAMRVGARFVPGGVVDAAFEAGSMMTDGRDNSAKEVSYRMGRAFVVGGTSALAGAYAGAAVGTALGTALPGIGNVIGFVVGAAVGALVGFIASSIIPSYEEMVQEQVPLQEFENAVAATDPQRLYDDALADQEYELLQAVVNHPVRGPYDTMGLYDQRNTSTSPFRRSWAEMVMLGEINGGCMDCHVQKDIDRFDSEIPRWDPRRRTPLEQLSESALRQYGYDGPRPTFMGQQLPGTTVGPEVMVPAMRRGSTTATEMATYINMVSPQMTAWNEVTGGNARAVVPGHLTNRIMSEEELKRRMQNGINARQAWSELLYGRMGEEEYELYRSWMKQAQTAQ